MNPHLLTKSYSGRRSQSPRALTSHGRGFFIRKSEQCDTFRIFRRNTGILDVCTRKIVGWNFSESLAHEGALAALTMAVKRQNPRVGLMFHSDRGVQFACQHFRARLFAFGFIQSMSRKGNCWDNAPMESFFHTFKTEFVYHEHFRTRTVAKAAVFEWIECFYNRTRIHSFIGYKTPVEMEDSFMLTKAA